MKKKIVAFVLVLALCLSFLVGCGLVVENQKRDFEQVVAKVGDSNIRKNELVNAVANYAPGYIQNYGLTIEEAVDLIMEQLIRRELQINEAIKLCAISGKAEDNSFIKLDGETQDSKIAKEYKAQIEKMLTCLEDNEIKKIEATAWKDINSIIEGYENEVIAGEETLILKKEDREAQSKRLEESAFEDRKTRPSFKEDDEKIEDYPELFFKEKVYGNLTSEDIGVNYPAVDENGNIIDKVEEEAYEMFVKKIKSVADTSVQEFMLNVVKEYMEEELIDKYQDKIEKQATADLNDSAVMMGKIQTAFDNMIKQQEENYTINIDAFDTYIKSQDRDTLSIYNAKGGYAEVKNLLIMFNGDTKSIINDLGKDNYTEAEYNKVRDLYASKLELKDLRQVKKLNPSFNASLKQTDYDYENKKEFEDSYYTSSDYVKGANDRFIPADKTQSYIPQESSDWKFNIASVVDGNVSFDNLKNYMADAMRVLAGETAVNTWAEGELNYSAKPEENIDKSLDKYEDAFIDLIYKFNEDSGMFDKANPNYMVNVLYQIGEKSTYVKEFQKASEELISNAIAKQADAENPSVSNLALEDRIQVVVTDYGVHVILLTNLFFKGEVTNAPSEDDLTIENTVTYNLAKLIRENAASKAYTDEVERIFNDAKANGGYETFPKVYKDISNL